MYVTKDKRILISEILKLGMSKPFYDVDVRIVVGREFVDSVSMSIRDRGVPVHSKGLYSIYASKDGIDQCLRGILHALSSSTARGGVRAPCMLLPKADLFHGHS